MPIEIRELVIKARVDSSSEGSGSGGQSSSAGPSEEVIQEIVDRVIEVLERKQER